MTTKHVLSVKYDIKSGDHYLQLTPDILSQVGWDFGDTLIWKDNEDGSFSVTKKMDNQTSDSTPNGNVDGTPPTTVGGST
jgi:hypothetical protein